MKILIFTANALISMGNRLDLLEKGRYGLTVEFSMSPSINCFLEFKESSEMCKKETYCRWQSLICAQIPSPSEEKVIAPCQGEVEITQYALPKSETHKGPFQPQGLLLSNITIRTHAINQYMPFLS